MENKYYNKVEEFHKAFGHKYSTKPTAIDRSTALNRTVWTGEELVEFLYATVKGDLGEFEMLFEDFIDGVDRAYRKMQDEQKPVDDVIVAQADALTDVEYFNQGTFTILGVKPDPLFDIVHEANMGKLHDGQPKYRKSDGKIIKPENWERDFAPEGRLKAEIERQTLKALNNEMLDRVDEDVFNSVGLIIEGANETLAKLHKGEKVISHLQVEKLKKDLSTQEPYSPLVVSNENEEGDK